jgi:hypothetical protein
MPFALVPMLPRAFVPMLSVEELPGVGEVMSQIKQAPACGRSQALTARAARRSTLPPSRDV